MRVLNKILAVIAICMFLVTASLVTEDCISSSEVTMNIQLDDDSNSAYIPSLMPKNTIVKDVQPIDQEQNSYKVLVRTKEKKDGLLTWLRGAAGIKNVEIIE